MDKLFLDEFSGYVDWEGEVEWVPIPAEPSDVSPDELPSRWRDALTGAKSLDDRIAILWKDLRPLLPLTFQALSSGLFGLAFLRTPQHPLSLVYILESEAGYTALRGFLPAKELPKLARLFSTDLSPMYSLHDGFVNIVSDDGGPLPCSEWEVIPDPDTGKPDFVKFTMDGSMALGFEVSKAPYKAYALWPDDEEVEEVDDVWAFLDELLAGGSPESG